MRVFVYGTLCDPARVREVAPSADLGPAATLYGLRRVEGRYPTLAPGGSVAGRILRTDDIAVLDAYEGVERGLYVRVSVPAEEGPVETYVGDPDRLDTAEPVAWPGSGPLAERVRAYVEDEGVTVRIEG
ncbi:gamma-glutamylcyclotransferase family protein [Halosegnis marinus]|uniref:Gamma-glutamylcyclotransferase n=1 Tax=Halosegnis marinus TaxID=3034023 RepID=A0ABD5ZNZ9_9EURY|nr:gamma-glutamylcyclotransferase family protein [Halosegnis sp. DT85]